MGNKEKCFPGTYLKTNNHIAGYSPAERNSLCRVTYQAESIGRNGEPALDFARYMKMRKDK